MKKNQRENKMAEDDKLVFSCRVEKSGLDSIDTEVELCGNDPEIIGRAISSTVAAGLHALIEDGRTKEEIAYALGGMAKPTYELIHSFLVMQISDMTQDAAERKRLLHMFVKGFEETPFVMPQGTMTVH